MAVGTKRQADDEGSSIVVDLGGDRLDLMHVECVERLGRPFTITADVYTPLGEIDILPHLGKPLAITIHEGEAERYFHGILTDSEFQRQSRFGYHYRLTLRPFTWFMDHNRAYAIHQDQSALAIIKAVFAAAGTQDIDYSKLTRTYAARTYCVQYGESDFAFVSRLMEEEGLYYYFDHQATRHVMMLCDAPACHAVGSPGRLRFNPDAVNIQFADANTAQDEALLHALLERAASGGELKVTLRDFDLTKPQQPVQGAWAEQAAHPRDAAELFRYPGGFTDEARGNALAQAELDARRHLRRTYLCETQSAGIRTGRLATISGHPLERLNASYLVVATHHSLTVRARENDQGQEQGFNTRFEAIPAATAFSTPAETPRPRVRGLETATVTGPEGETIYTDQYGRVKLRFPWDRSGSPGETSTCWVRVAQFGNLGSVILPRVGQEVMVDFIAGDPDRPVVCGWTFNQALMPTYALPANKTRALWRTKRYGETGQYPNAKALDTGAPGVNELRFEDKGGAEEVFLHAERDMNTRIRFAETHHVGQNQALMVGYDRTDEVGHDETVTIGNNQTATVGAARDVTVNATDKLTVSRSITVSAGSTIEVTAGTSITLKVGMSSIVIDNGGVTIKGMQVTVEGEATATVKSANTSVQGIATTAITGGMVTIN